MDIRKIIKDMNIIYEVLYKSDNENDTFANIMMDIADERMRDIYKIIAEERKDCITSDREVKALIIALFNNMVKIA